MYSHVIVRRPCKAMVGRITSSPELGAPDYEKALCQHDAYIAAMKSCGVEVMVLEADERYPDSCFVEDPAVVTERCAIVTNRARRAATAKRKRLWARFPVIIRRARLSTSPKARWKAGT